MDFLHFFVLVLIYNFNILIVKCISIIVVLLISDSRLLLALLPNRDRLVVCHGRRFNARTELNGTLLLDSILQSRVQSPSDVVTIDLSHADAVYFLKVLQNFDPVKYEDDINVKEFKDFLLYVIEAVSESEVRLNTLPTKLTRVSFLVYFESLK